MPSHTALSVICSLSCLSSAGLSRPDRHSSHAPLYFSFPYKPCCHFVLPLHTLALLPFLSLAPRFLSPYSPSLRPRSLTVAIGLASLSLSSRLRVAPLLTRLSVSSLLSWLPYYSDVRFRSPSLGGPYALLATFCVLLVSHFPFIVHRSFHQLSKVLSRASSNISVPLLSAP